MRKYLLKLKPIRDLWTVAYWHGKHDGWIEGFRDGLETAERMAKQP